MGKGFNNDFFERWTASGFEGWRVAFQIAETMMASYAVIGARLAMIGAGAMNPRRMPYAELGRLVPEKSAAFGKAHAGATQALMAPSKAQASQLPAALLHDGLIMLDLWERVTAMSGAWWKPVHARATANHRRLHRQRRFVSK